MKFMGSKNRIAKHILPIMLKERGCGQPWVEPFVGGGNMIDKVAGVRYRIGYDADPNVISALISIRDYVHELPKNNIEFTEKDYADLRHADNYPHKGYAGFAFSYSGKWMGGWCRDGAGKRDYVAEAYRNAVKQSKRLQGVYLFCKDYLDITLPAHSLIYCDPPYSNTTSYGNNFDHDTFWDWCREMRCLGHKIFISEYTAPNDFVCVWEREIASSLTQDTGSKTGIEKLFTLT